MLKTEFLYLKLAPIDIAPALAVLASANFGDTGGSNGWLTDPAPFMPFVESLGLGGVILAVHCRLLPAWRGIPPHIDPFQHRSDSVQESRFHVPLVTHPGVTMRWPDDGVDVHLEAGYIYGVNFRRLHEVVHRAPIGRVHLQINVANATMGFAC